ncbi:MAG TPA: phosphomannomutase/phosphoglucomutase [Candidatus Paceibacterota bacterium]|nr:phosphomannomutase/phosphoglucomutase [Candidatus Paceibacterota bacterium]
MNSIFRAYDVRGVYPSEVNEDLAFRIGVAAVRYLGAGVIVVGHDDRQGSESMASRVIAGAAAAGASVINIGPATTPLFNFSVSASAADGGIMITASHNPAQYNGFKIIGRQGAPVGADSGLAEIEKLLDESAPAAPAGRIETRDFCDDYVNFLLEVSGAAGEDLGRMRIVVDASNGMTPVVLKNLFKKINVNVLEMFFEINGRFPNHQPDVSRPENIQQLQAKVVASGAHMGFAFDGDGDRLAVVDETGRIIWPDITLGLLYNALGHPKTVYDIRVSRSVKALLGSQGIPSRVGHTFIKETMRDYDAGLGGELSGHFYFKSMHYAESAALAMLYLLVMAHQASVPFSELVRPLVSYARSGELSLPLNNQAHAKIILDRLKQKYADGNISEMDGVSVEYPDWWFNLRASNTEPILRLFIEAANNQILKNKQTELLKLIES